MVEAQAGKISVEQQQLTYAHRQVWTHGSARGKSSQASVAAASKQGMVPPVSPGRFGDTVRRVPDESLLAKTRDAVLKERSSQSRRARSRQDDRSASQVRSGCSRCAKAATPAQKPATTPAPVEKATPAAKAASASVSKVAPTENRRKSRHRRRPRSQSPSPSQSLRARQCRYSVASVAGYGRRNDPLAEAIAAARAELGPSLSAEPAKPIKARPVEPLPKGAAKLIPTDFEPTRQIVVPHPGEKGGFPDFAALSEPSKTEMSTAPSAESPSVSWLAMAAEEDPFGARRARCGQTCGASGAWYCCNGRRRGQARRRQSCNAGSRWSRHAVLVLAVDPPKRALLPFPFSGGTISPQRILATLDGRSSMASGSLLRSWACPSTTCQTT